MIGIVESNSPKTSLLFLIDPADPFLVFFQLLDSFLTFTILINFFQLNLTRGHADLKVLTRHADLRLQGQLATK